MRNLKLVSLMTWVLAASTACAVGGSVRAEAPTPTPPAPTEPTEPGGMKNLGGDQRVRVRLDELGFKYRMSASGRFELILSMGGAAEAERTQVVAVDSVTQKLGHLEIREISAPAAVLKNPVSAEVANRLLRDNDDVKLGAWRIRPESRPGANTVQVIFTVQIPADSPKETLELAIAAVASTADEMEKELTGTDDF